MGTLSAALPRTASSEESESGISWAAVLAGAFVAAALWFSLSVLGAGIGLSAVSPWPAAGVTAERVAPGAIIWVMIVQALACSLGGYLAGRLRTKWSTLHSHEVFFRDTAHGFLAWAVGLVIAILFLSSVGLSLAKDAAAVAAEGKNDYYVDMLFRGEHPSAEANDLTLRGETRAILAKTLRSSSISPKDKTYLTELVAERTGLDRAAAETRVNETEAAARERSTRPEKRRRIRSIGFSPPSFWAPSARALPRRSAVGSATT